MTTLTYDQTTSALTELVNAQATGWDYAGRPNRGRVAREARRRARELRAGLGWPPPYSRGSRRGNGHDRKAYAR